MAKSKSKPKKNKGKYVGRKASKAEQKLAKARGKANAKRVAARKAAAVLPARCNAHPLRPVVKFKAGGTLWAGSLASVRLAVQNRMVAPELVIDLSGYIDDLNMDPVVAGNTRAREELPAVLFTVDVLPPALLKIEWDDGGVPYELDEMWWKALADHVIKSKGDVLICCQGGHGRTGTALSILLDLLGVCGNEGEHGDAVVYLRESYCHQAVESESQIAYIEDITHMKTTAEPSDPLGGWWTESVKGATGAPAGTTPAWEVDDNKPSVNGNGNWNGTATTSQSPAEIHANADIITAALKKAGVDGLTISAIMPEEVEDVIEGEDYVEGDDEKFLEEMEARHDNPDKFVGIKGA